MKKLTIILIATALIGIFAMSVMICACTPSDEQCTLALSQYYSANSNPYFTQYFDNENKLNIAEKINSVEELKTFCQKIQVEVFADDSLLKNDNVCKKLKEYDKEFFKKYSILLVLRFEKTTDFCRYESADIKNNVLTISYITSNGSNTTAERQYVDIFEISKKLTKNINQIDIEQNIGEIDQNIGIKIFEHHSLLIKNDLNYSTTLTSVAEIDTLINTLFDKDDKFSETERTVEMFKQYDDEFFQEKSIIALFRFRSSSSFFYRLKDYEINENTINIVLARKLPSEPGFYPTMVITCIYLLEVDKAIASSISHINVEEIEE